MGNPKTLVRVLVRVEHSRSYGHRVFDVCPISVAEHRADCYYAAELWACFAFASSTFAAHSRPIVSTASCSNAGARWAYRHVIRMDLWPINSWTVRSGTPFITKRLAKVCRRSCQ